MAETAALSDKIHVLDFLKTNKRDLARFKVRKLGLFGSYFRGQQTEKSDIDFLVEFEEGKKTFDNFIGLVDYLESAFGKEVELVTKEAVSKHILPYIEKEISYVKIID